MPPPLLLFGLSIACSFLAWGVLCASYLWPRVRDLPLQRAARPILFLHVFRFVGLAFLIPGVAGPTLPSAFAMPAAFGDLTAAALAWLAIALCGRPGFVVALWVFNTWGTLDLLLAFYNGLARARIEPGMLGAAYFIPTVLVPLLLCTHVVIFALLIKGRPAGSGR
jgi:hypothetical protein